MVLLDFNLNSLGELDSGRVGVAFEQALSRLISDLRDRPGDGAKRNLTLDIAMTPVVDDGGNLTSAKVQCLVKDKIPTRKSRVYDMQATRKGLHFNELSPDDHRQLTIDDAGGPQQAVSNGSKKPEEVTRAS